MGRDGFDLSITLGKLKLKNPVMSSSGTFGYGREFADIINLDALGAIIVKGTTLHPRMGNPENRYVEISGCGYLTCVGLQNVGVERFVEEKLPFLRQFRTPVIVNIAGETIEEFVKITEILNMVEGVSGLEVNLCCPNVQGGGMSFASDEKMTFDVINAVKNATNLTVLAKVFPTVTDIVTLGKACEEAGADAICPIFSPMGMAIDIHTRRSKLGKNLTGALGGPSLKPVTIRLVWQLVQVVNIPVIGCGGITGAEDALEYMIVGATAIEIGANNLVDPMATVETAAGIRKYMKDKRIKRIGDIVGSAVLS